MLKSGKRQGSTREERPSAIVLLAPLDPFGEQRLCLFLKLVKAGQPFEGVRVLARPLDEVERIGTVRGEGLWVRGERTRSAEARESEWYPLMRARESVTHCFRAPRAPVVGLPGNFEILKAREEAADLVRHDAERRGGLVDW